MALFLKNLLRDHRYSLSCPLPRIGRTTLLFTSLLLLWIQHQVVDSLVVPASTRQQRRRVYFPTPLLSPPLLSAQQHSEDNTMSSDSRTIRDAAAFLITLGLPSILQASEQPSVEKEEEEAPTTPLAAKTETTTEEKPKKKWNPRKKPMAKKLPFNNVATPVDDTDNTQTTATKASTAKTIKTDPFELTTTSAPTASEKVATAITTPPPTFTVSESSLLLQPLIPPTVALDHGKPLVVVREKLPPLSKVA